MVKMKKNLFIYISLVIIVLILMVQCVRIQVRDNEIAEAPINIAPYPEKTIELATLHFKSAKGDFLGKETRVIERTFESREEAILKELIKGPTEDQLEATIPAQTKVFSVLSVNGTTYINFSKEFANPLVGGDRNEATTIYSIVNSLTEIRTVRRIQILVEGERLDFYQKHISLREPFARLDMINREALSPPIGVIREYLESIANNEFRGAFEKIYRPVDYDLDFLIFYNYMSRNKLDVREYDIITYSIFIEAGEVRLVVDFNEITEANVIKRFRNFEFILKNDFGEWKLVPLESYKL